MVQTAVKNVDIVLTVQGAILKLEYVPTVARQAGKVYFVHKVRTIFSLKTTTTNTRKCSMALYFMFPFNKL
jgi:hypothetical protein